MVGWGRGGGGGSGLFGTTSYTIKLVQDGLVSKVR